jgi:hypothetical protein
MRRLLLSIGVFLSVLGVRAVLHTNFALPVQAQSSSSTEAPANLGTHLAHFDPGAQQGVLQLIRSKIGQPEGYPVTVMIGTTWSEEDMRKVAGQAGGFRVTIRVIEVNANTTTDQVTAFAQTLNTIPWSSASKPIVVFGNELNNLNDEWQNTGTTVAEAGAKYAELHQSFEAALDKSKYDLAPTTMDPYNTAFAWQPFVTAANTGIYKAFSSNNNAAFAANVFEPLTGSGTWTTIRIAAQNTSGRLVFTEFGPPNPKDVSLDIYDQFYKNNALPSGVEYGTVLIAQDCVAGKAQFGWIYWIKGKFFDIEGNTVDPKTCEVTGDGATNFDESSQIDPEVSGLYVYKDIFADTVKFGQTGDPRADLEGGLSRAQRYIMTCAPQFWIGAQIDDQNLPVYWTKLQEAKKTLAEYCLEYAQPGMEPDGTNEPNCLFDPITSNFKVLNNNLRTPLYRRSKTTEDGTQIYDSNRAESFEAFFGVNTKLGRTSGDPLLLSPNKKLFSLQDQCSQSVTYLKAIDVLCKEPTAHLYSDGQFGEQPAGGGCALNNTFLDEGGASHTYIEVLQRVKAESPEADPQSFCDQNIDDWDEETTKLLAQVQPLTKNAFKIGYLVYYNTGRYKRDTGKPLDQQADFDAFGEDSQYFHPVYRTYEEYYGQITFDVIPFLVPANIASAPWHEEVLVDPNLQGESYTKKMDANFMSPYLQSLRALFPYERLQQIVDDENARRNAVGSAGDYGINYKGDNGINMWNGLNNVDNVRKFIECPICDPDFPTPAGVQKTDYGANELNFARVIWHRINAGIYAKEFTEYLQREGYREQYTSKDEENPEPTVVPPPDGWSSCNVAPELLRGETAQTLNADVDNPLWGEVKDSITRINAIIRAPGGAREDKYNFYMKGFLLLPQEYGLLMQTEGDFLSTLLSLEDQKQVFIDEQKQHDFSSLIGVANLNPEDPGYNELVPEYNRFLRLNGQLFELTDETAGKSGEHGEGQPEWYYTESLQEFNARRAQCLTNASPDQCENLERKNVTINAKLNSWNPGWNTGKTDLRPILPGGWLARGIFEIMAHITAPFLERNYQEKYCGLEDYWIRGTCAKFSPQFSSSKTGTGDVGDGVDCRDATNVEDVSPQASLPAFVPTKNLFGKPALDEVIARAAYWAQIPESVLAAIAIMEGQIDRFSNAQLATYSEPGEYIPDLCAPTPPCGAMGPMQILTKFTTAECSIPADQNTWNSTGVGYQLAYSSVVAGERPAGYVPNPANVVDAMFAAANFIQYRTGVRGVGNWNAAVMDDIGTKYYGSCDPVRYSYHHLYETLLSYNEGLGNANQPTAEQRSRVTPSGNGALTYCEFIKLYALPRM